MGGKKLVGLMVVVIFLFCGAGAFAQTAAINVTPPSSTAVPANYSFTASLSSGAISYVNWDFGDGTVAAMVNGSPANSNTTFSYTYNTAGTYTITATVIDTSDNAFTATTTISVTVASSPTAFITVTAPSTGAVPNAQFSFQADLLNANTTISSISWDFGDGSVPQSGNLVSHSYSLAGTYTVTATVTDTSNSVFTATTSVVVNNVAASIAENPTAGAAIGTAVSFTASLSSGTITSVGWDYGDGFTDSGISVSHTYSAAGGYTVTATITDINGNTFSATTTVGVFSSTGGSPELDLSGGAPAASAGTTNFVMAGSTQFTVLQFNVFANSSNNINVSSDTFTASGTMDQSSIAASLYVDMDNVGVVDANSILLGTATYSNGQFVFSGGGPIPAFANRSLILVYNIPGTANPGDTFGVSIAANTDVSADVSGSPVSVFGAPIAGFTYTIESAAQAAGQELDISTSTISGGALNSVLAGSNDSTALQFNLFANGVSMDINSVAVTTNGSMNQTALAARLYLDVDNVFTLDANSLFLGSATFSNGQYVFSGGTLISAMPAGASYSCIIVFDVPSTANSGDTFSFNIAPSGPNTNMTTDVTAVVSGTANSVPVFGAPVAGLNFVIGQAGSQELDISIGATPAGSVLPGTNNMPVLQFNLLARGADADISSITVTTSGTMDQSSVTATLYRDVDGLGVVDANSIFLATATFSNGKFVFSGSPLESVPAYNTDTLIVVYNVVGTNLGDTFGASIAANTDVTASVMVSGATTSTTVSGAPVTGATLTIGQVEATADNGLTFSNSMITGTGSVSAVFNAQFANAVSYQWDFDFDGVNFSPTFFSQTSGTTNFTYSVPGIHTAHLLMTFADGSTQTQDITVDLTAAAGAPTATGVGASFDGINFFSPLDGTNIATPGAAPVLVYFKATITTTANIVLYEWDFDGCGCVEWSSPTPDETTWLYFKPNLDGSGNPIPYAAKLTAVDDQGNAVTATVNVTIAKSTTPPPSTPSIVVEGDGKNGIYLDNNGNGTYDAGTDTQLDTNNDGKLTIVDTQKVWPGEVVSIDVQSTPAAGRKIAFFEWDTTGNGTPDLWTPATDVGGVGKATAQILFSNPGKYFVTVFAVDGGGGGDQSYDTTSLQSDKSLTIEIDVATPTADNTQAYWVQPDPNTPNPNHRLSYSGDDVTLMVNVVPVTNNPPNVEFRYRDLTAANDVYVPTTGQFAGQVVPKDPVSDVLLSSAVWASDALSSNTVTAPPYQTGLDTTKLTEGHWYEIAAFVDIDGTGNWVAKDPTTKDINGTAAYFERVFIKVAAKGAKPDVTESTTVLNTAINIYSDNNESLSDKGAPKCDCSMPFGCLNLDSNGDGVDDEHPTHTKLDITNEKDSANPNPDQSVSGGTLSFVPGTLMNLTVSSDQYASIKLDKPARVKIYYTATGADGKGGGTVGDQKETDLVLYHYSSKDKMWEQMANQTQHFADKATGTGYIEVDAPSFSPFALAGLALAAAAGGGGAGGGAALGALAAVALCGTTGFDALIALGLVFWINRYLRSRKACKQS